MFLILKKCTWSSSLYPPPWSLSTSYILPSSIHSNQIDPLPQKQLKSDLQNCTHFIYIRCKERDAYCISVWYACAECGLLMKGQAFPNIFSTTQGDRGRLLRCLPLLFSTSSLFWTRFECYFWTLVKAILYMYIYHTCIDSKEHFEKEQIEKDILKTYRNKFRLHIYYVYFDQQDQLSNTSWSTHTYIHTYIAY